MFFSKTMKRLYAIILLAVVAVVASAAVPNGSGTYYRAANGYKGAALKTALCGIIYNRTEKSYDYLWTAFQTTDKRSDGKVWDMYSNISNFRFGTDQAGSYSKEGDAYNREHSFPKSWFGGDVRPMYTDLHHMYPTDGYVNNKRANYPFGETSGNKYKSANDFSKLGNCTYPGYTGIVFEPADEYKGDFARTYFYMVTCYEEKLADWYSNNSESRATIDGSTYPGFQTWQLNMLLAWAAADPVSDKETARNIAVKNIQGNRNPFIDYPGLEQYIWGSKKNDSFSYDNYVQPDGSSSGSGGGEGGDTGDIAGTYKLTITSSDFTTTSYAANNNEKTSLAVCTTDPSKTYEVKWTSYQVYQNSGNMQWQKEKGCIYNSTDLGTIESVNVTSSGGTFTTYYGTAEKPLSSTTAGGGFFQTKVGNATGKTSKVEITFTIAGSGSTLTDPSFNNLTDVNVNYGSTLTLTQGTTGTPNFLTDGAVTLNSLNPEVVTVSGLTITPVAVGTAYISVNTDATAAYYAGSIMFPITVKAPAGKTTAYVTETTATLDFTTNSWGLPVGAENKVVEETSCSNDTYTITLAGGTSGSTDDGFYYNSNDKYLLLGKTGAYLTLPAFDNAVTQIDVVGKAGASTNVRQKIYVDNTDVSTESTGATGTNTFVINKLFRAPGNIYKLKVVNGYKTQITSIIVHFAESNLTATLNEDGYATYCSEYPLDFSNYETADYSAWQITGVSGTAITFEQVTGKVKGGTGLLLKGGANATVTLTSADSSDELDGNLLYGTLAPTYVEADSYYGLSGNNFVKVNAGTVSEGKALLPASVVDGNDVKAFTFVFEEDATGIKTLSDSPLKGENIYNLAGQRMNKMQKGINIVNGKKIIIK